MSRKPRTSGKIITCKACGKEKRVPLDRVGFCSRRCAFNWRTANKQLSVITVRRCEGGCGAVISGGRKMCSECRALDKWYRRLESLEFRCVDCGKWAHKAATQSWRKRCDGCRAKSQEASFTRLKASRKQCRNTIKGKARRRQEKRTREHKKREAAANSPVFTDWQVFVRDKWLCQLCGCKVRKVVGECNYFGEATIDHIVPLSRGGRHSMANCQTACRECNVAKGASVSE